jgi:hypothetical protein
MNMVNDELSINGIDGVKEQDDSDQRINTSRFFNPIAWPKSNEVLPEDEAAWINTLSVYKVGFDQLQLDIDEPDKSSPLYNACKSLALSRGRELMASGFVCPVPGNPEREVTPMAMIFIGGKTKDFSGCMPGVLEEFIFALEKQRPVFVLGGFGGAAAIICETVYGNATTISDVFKPEYYGQDEAYKSVLDAYKKLKVASCLRPHDRLRRLYEQLVSARTKGFGKVCRNGLSEFDTQILATTTDTLAAVHLIWKGLSKLLPPSPK